MVVALVRDDDTVRDAVDFTDAQNARIFTDRDEHVRRTRRQLLQEGSAALIRAVLAPLDRKRVRFGARRIASDASADRAQLGWGERERLATCEALEFCVGTFEPQRLG